MRGGRTLAKPVDKCSWHERLASRAVMKRYRKFRREYKCKGNPKQTC